MKKKFDKDAFGAYYNALPEDEKRRVRDEFLSATGLSYPSWYTKRCRGVFKPLELKLLEKITGKNFSVAVEKITAKNFSV